MYKVVVITPEGVYLETDVKELYVPTPNGVILVNKRHTDLVSSLSVGIMRTKADVTKYYAIMGGVIEVNSEKATIVTTDILESSEINVERAKESLKRNQERLAKDDPNIDKKRAKASTTRAQVRIEVALKEAMRDIS